MKKEDKKVMSLKRVAFFTEVIPGITFFIYGIINLKLLSNIITTLLAVIILPLMVIPYVALFKRKDKDDEASKLHTIKAGAISGILLELVITVIWILYILKIFWEFSIGVCAPFLLSMYMFVHGLLFIHYEEDGDC